MARKYALTMYLSGEGKQVYDAVRELASHTGLSVSTIMFMCLMAGWAKVSAELHQELPSPPPPKKKSAKVRSRVQSA